MVMNFAPCGVGSPERFRLYEGRLRAFPAIPSSDKQGGVSRHWIRLAHPQSAMPLIEQGI